MASIFDVLTGLANKGNEAVQSNKGQSIIADVARLAEEKKKVQAAIDASIKKAGVKPSVISAPSSAPIDTGLSDLAQKAQSFPQLEGLLPSNQPVSVQNEETKSIIQNLFSRIKKPVVDMGASAIQNLNPIAAFLNKTNVPFLKNAADYVGNKDKISGALSGAITGAIEQPASNLFESMQALRKKQEARTNTTMGDRINDLLSSGTMTAGAAISALPVAAQYNAVVGGLKGNEQTKGLGEGIDAATMAVPNAIGSGINRIPGLNEEQKGALSMLANLGLVTAGGKIGEGIGKRIDAGNLGRAANVVGKELTGNKATMFSGIDPTPFLKGVKEFAKNPIVQSLDPTGIAGGIGGTNGIKKDPFIEDSTNKNDFNFNQNEFDAINEKIASAKNDAKNAEDTFYNNNRKPNEKPFTNNDFIEKTLATEKKGGWLSNLLQPAKNLPQDFQEALANWKREKLTGQNRANTEAYSMKDSLAPITSKESILGKVMNNETSIGEAGKKFIEFMQNPTKEAAKKLGINFEESKKITDQFGRMFDNLRDEAIKRGLDFGYIENYLPQLWKDAPQKIQEVFSKSVSSKPFFSKERILEDYNLGIKMGLTPKYSHPAQLLGEYIKKMEDSLANKKLVDTLVENKYIAPTDIANMDNVGKDWKVVEIPGLPSGGFKAPPAIQKVLHNIFGVTEVSDILQKGADTSAFMQKSKLTGGTGTVNGFTVGQAFKEMALGIAHPIDTIKNIVTGKGTGLTNAFTRGISKNASQKYFIDPVNSNAIKELANHNVELNSPLDYKNMFQNAFEKNKGTSIKEKIVGGAKYSAQKVMDVVNHSDNDTFNQFMPILQVEFYKKAKDRLLKQGMNAEQAVKIASEQTKNFYGSVNYDLLGRSKNVQNFLSMIFFAPRFREGILNVFYNTGKALSTEFKNKSFAENRKFAAGLAITYGLYNALNYKLNGRFMWENQSGREGDLEIPQEDGSVIRIPFMTSFMTMPRNAVGVVKNLLGGDIKEAVKSASGFMSMPIQMGKQLLTNEDYFGNPIYTEQIGTNRKGETNTTFDKFKDQALYAGSGLTNSYLQSIIDYARGKKTGSQAITAALELPIKYGKQKDQSLEKGFGTYINYINLKNDIERLQKDNKDGSKKGEIDAKIQEMKDQAGALSEQDKLTYQGYRSGKLIPQGQDYDTMIQAKYGGTTVKGEATAAAQPVYDNLLKIKELSKDAQGNKDEMIRLFAETKQSFDALSPYEKKNGFMYLLNKKAKTVEEKKKMIELSKKLFNYDALQE